MNLYAQAQREFMREMKRNGTTVILRWRQNSGGTVHPTTRAVTGGTDTQQSETVKGFFQPMDAKTQVRLFNELREGMAYLDLAPDVVVAGRSALVFDIDGRTWVQDKAGEQLIEHFDTVQRDRRYGRTIMLRLQT